MDNIRLLYIDLFCGAGGNSALRQKHRERNDNTAGNYGKGSYRQIWISAYIERTSIVYKGD